MPAVRDFAQNYTSSTSALGFVVSAPDYDQNDLLVAVCSADTGTQMWIIGEPLTYAYRDVAGVITNYTTESNNDTTGDVQFLTTGTPAVNHAFYVGDASTFNAVSCTISTAGVGTWTIAWEYYNSAGVWTAVPGLVDGTTNLTAATGERTARFTVPGDWATTTLQSQTLYWVRARVATYSAVTTRPLGTRVRVGKWPRLFTATNTVNLGICYKIAGASEPVEYMFAYPTAETANGAIVSVRDINTSRPFSTVAPTAQAYSESNYDSDQALNDVVGAVSQSFVGVAAVMHTAKFYLKKFGSPTGNMVARLYAHSGVLGTSSVPTGVPLATSTPIAVSTLTTSYQLIEFIFPWDYALTATNWCIVLEYTSGDASNYVLVGYDVSSAGHAGNKATYSGIWIAQATHDVCFYVYNFTYTTGTATAAKSTMPTMTTSDNNSLILWTAANAGTSTTTLYNTNILEGPCTWLFGKDGTGHSDACSWGILRTAGTTPSTVSQSNLGTGTQTIVTAVVGINPPAGGATIIPTYCGKDLSTYISPLTGAAYNGDSAPATTVTSVFGTLLNGKTLAAGGSTVTRADTGINTYHAMANCTGLTTVNQWGGIRMTFAVANKPNITSKNLLFHTQPYLPLDMQTTDSVALIGTCGVAIGVSSVANTDYKVYHVGGANTPWDVARGVPVVINTDYVGAGMIQNTGTLAPASIAELGFMVSSKVVAASWLFGSCWLLSTTAVVGGNSTYPIGIPGIVQAAATGHERRSVIQQGASQFMIFQPIDIGDGGTNETHLYLDSTALEFPRQYDKESKNVNYCSVDNVCGLKYYAGPNDVIVHTNSVISSASRYHWGFQTGSSASASYDFSGLSVIGAGQILLNLAVTLHSITINNYSTLNLSGLTLHSSIITSVPATNDSVTLSVSSALDGCSINVSTVTAGNRWCSVSSPSIFTNCSFTGGGGHAIRITTAGTYSFTGNSFTGFGANGSTGAAIYNDSGGLVTINVTNGTTPSYFNVGVSTTVVNNLVAVTVTPLQDGSEVRAYLTGTATEVAGTESSTGGAYVLNLASGVAVDIVVLCYLPPMKPVRKNNRSFAVSQNFDPGQQTDPNFSP
jgi:hypothetical protein